MRRGFAGPGSVFGISSYPKQINKITLLKWKKKSYVLTIYSDCIHLCACKFFMNAFTCVIRKSVVRDAVQLVQQEQLQVSNTDCGDLHIHGVSKPHIEGRNQF